MDLTEGGGADGKRSWVGSEQGDFFLGDGFGLAFVAIDRKERGVFAVGETAEFQRDVVWQRGERGDGLLEVSRGGFFVVVGGMG